MDAEAFNQLVLEEGLKTWEAGGYTYTGKKGVRGWELYRTYGPRWAKVYQARRVLSQTNAGGGALTLRISIRTGIVAKLLAMYVEGTASAGATLLCRPRDEDGAIAGYFANIAAGVSRDFELPSPGASATTTSNNEATNGFLLAPGMFITTVASAAANTETLTAYIMLLLPIEATEADVVWDTTGSAGTPSLAASTISAVNTLQAVLTPCQ